MIVIRMHELDLDVKELLALIGYNEEEINFLNALSEYKTISYFDTAPLNEIKQLLDALNKKIKEQKEHRLFMEKCDLNEIGHLLEFTKKEFMWFKNDWKKQIEECKNIINTLVKIKERFETDYDERQNNGEVVEEKGKDVTNIIKEFINSVTNDVR